MRLRVDDITGEEKALSFCEPEQEINRVLEQGALKEYHLEQPLGVDVSYYRSGTELFFAGRLRAQTRATCARCAEDFVALSERSFRFVVVKRVPGEFGLRELPAEDLGLSHYVGDEVDLSPLIREQFLLALPTRALCREECRGLCPICGQNLNLGACGCRPRALDSRLGSRGGLRASGR